MYRIRDDVSDIVQHSDKKNTDIFAFTFEMLFWEQYAVIEEKFYRNLVLAICVVFIITLILIPKISASLLVLLTVVSTIVDVLGCMYFWGLTIDAVTVCYTVIAIGLSVDYSAHVGEAYMLSMSDEPVIDALYRMGASVFNGAFSTFLAVVAMASSQTYVFRVFFQQFFLVTLLGSFHGLIVLPVLLVLCRLKPIGMVTDKQEMMQSSSAMKGNANTNDNEAAVELNVKQQDDGDENLDTEAVTI
jgi:hypothetical protein